MIPIHRLLARIRWDPRFGSGRFEIGYLDKVSRSIRRVPLQQAVPDPDNPGLLEIFDDDGIRHRVPLHRIREVLRDGKTIWRRGARPERRP